jgi:hypothetical protein
MIKGGYHLAKVKPTIDVLPNTAWDAGDVLFDWYAFEIPRGACKLSTLNVIIPGTDTAAATGIDMELFFATSVNGVAPPSLGNPDDAITKIKATACKNHIIGHKYLDASVMENSDELVSFNIWTNTLGNATATTDAAMVDMILEGDPVYSGATAGYQTIWVAALTVGTPNHGTGVLLDGAIATGDAGAQTLDVSEDQDADDVFAVGDELLAAASDGSSVQKIGTITALTADTITIDAKDIFGTSVWSSGALVDDDEICFRRPFTFHLGFEY